MTDMWSSYSHKTRILVLGHDAGSLFRYIQDFHGKGIDVIAPASGPSCTNDFALLVTDSIEAATSFSPNIVLNTLGSEKDITNSIVAGGVYIYPEDEEQSPERIEPTVYCRRIPFQRSKYTLTEGKTVLETELGLLPLSFNATAVLNNLEGVRILCQQTGMMEEAFYEALLNYSDAAVD